MYSNRKFLKKPFVFLILFFGLAAIGGAYSSWHFALSAEMKMTSGVMDILFAGSIRCTLQMKAEIMKL